MTTETLPGVARLRERLATFRYSLFRLETLQAYSGSNEDEAFAAYRAGRPIPVTAELRQWCARYASGFAMAAPSSGCTWSPSRSRSTWPSNSRATHRTSKLARTSASFAYLKVARGLRTSLVRTSGWSMPPNCGPWPTPRIHQTRVSKLETGVQRPTEADVRQWAAATRATADKTDELLELLAASRVEYATFGQLYRRHGSALADQAATAARDAETSRIAVFQPSMMPGLVQAAAYAREVLSLPCGPSLRGVSAEEIEALVGERIKRQQVLYEPGKKIQLVMGEAALHVRFGPPATMLGQLDRLATVTGLAGVEVGVVPLSTPFPIYPLTDFTLYDDSVLIESVTGQQRIEGMDEVALYEQFFDQLRDAAATGQDAIALIQRVAAGLR